MSSVPPSPPWPITLTSSRPLARMAAAIPVLTAGALPNSEWIQGSSRALGIGGGEDLEAACRVRRDQLAPGRPHRRVEHEAGAERLAAALAGSVAAGERVGALSPGLYGALLGVEQPATDRVGARLVELDLLGGHLSPCLSGAPRRPRRFRAGCSRRAGPAVGRRPRGQLSGNQLGVEVEHLERLELVAPGSFEQLPSESRVIARPPSPAITVVQRVWLCARASWMSVETMPPRPTASAFSSTTTRQAPARASRTSSSGNGRNDLIPSAPTRTPASRISSTTSSIVPSTEPRATRIVSAPSVR